MFWWFDSQTKERKINFGFKREKKKKGRKGRIFREGFLERERRRVSVKEV